MSEIKIGRRDLLHIAGIVGGASLLGGCVRQPEGEKSVAIPRENGQWQDNVIESLARKMVSETALKDVAFAGAILIDNQKGRPSFSRISPIFIDKDDKVKVVNTAVGSLSNVLGSGPAAAFFDPDTLTYQVNLPSKTNGPSYQMYATRGLHFAEVQFDTNYIKGYSDFMIEFMMAKEIMNATTIDMFTSYLLNTSFASQYVLPSATEDKKRIQAGLFYTEFKNISALAIVDLWAHFIMVPNFLAAWKLGKLTNTDLERGEMGVFTMAANYFHENGVLSQNKDGDFEWTQDVNKFFDSWFNLSFDIYRQTRK